MKWCLDPSRIAGLEYDEFAHLVAPRIKTLGQAKRLKAIWELAVDSIGCEAGQAMDFEAKLMVEDLNQVGDSIGAVDDHIEEICLGFPEYNCLLTIPGFGPDVSSKVLSAIGNPFRFDNGKQVLKLTGYDLSARCLLFPKRVRHPLDTPFIRRLSLLLQRIGALLSITPINFVAGRGRKGLRQRCG